MTDPPLVRFVVIEGSENSGAALKALLVRQIGWSVVYLASEVSSAIEAIRRDSPEVAIVGDAAPGSGPRLVRRICETSAAKAVGVRLGDTGPDATEEYLRAGARGCVDEKASDAELLRALRRVIAGGIGLSPAIEDALVAHLLAASSLDARLPEEEASPDLTLSHRERQVYALIGKGRTTKEIAQSLKLSPQTVAYYRYHLKHKLGLRSSAQLTRHATLHFLRGRSGGGDPAS